MSNKELLAIMWWLDHQHDSDITYSVEWVDHGEYCEYQIIVMNMTMRDLINFYRQKFSVIGEYIGEQFVIDTEIYDVW